MNSGMRQSDLLSEYGFLQQVCDSIFKNPDGHGIQGDAQFVRAGNTVFTGMQMQYRFSRTVGDIDHEQNGFRFVIHLPYTRKNLAHGNAGRGHGRGFRFGKGRTEQGTFVEKLCIPVSGMDDFLKEAHTLFVVNHVGIEPARLLPEQERFRKVVAEVSVVVPFCAVGTMLFSS